MELSIIIPVYNVEKYIEKCILSTLNQDLSNDNYEIIVVDDESPDNSKGIVQRIQRDYSQIKLFNQKNKGLGGARNTGILNAKGDYLLFLDADDYLNGNALKEIVAVSKKKSLDILEFGAVGITLSGRITYKKAVQYESVYKGFYYLGNKLVMNSACNKLYRKDFLLKNDLLFVERIYIEDYEFNTRAYYYANNVTATDKIVSNFVQSSDSITRNKNREKNFKMVNDIFEVIKMTLSFKKNIMNIKNNEIIDSRIGFLVVTLLYTMLKFRIPDSIRKNMILRLSDLNIYPVKVEIRDHKKNLFRYFVNNRFMYNTIGKLLNLTSKL